MEHPVGRAAAHRGARRRRRWIALVMCGALLMLAAGCSEDAVGGRGDVVDVFERKGYTPVMAECLADETIAEFGLDRMYEDLELTTAEHATMTALTDACIAEVGIDDVTVPTSAAATTTIAPTTTVAATTTIAPTTTVAATTTIAPTTTVGPTTTG